MKQKKNLWILIGVFVVVLVLAGAAYQFLSPTLRGNNLMVEGLPEGETVQSSQPEQEEASSDEKNTSQAGTAVESEKSSQSENSSDLESSSQSETFSGAENSSQGENSSKAENSSQGENSSGAKNSSQGENPSKTENSSDSETDAENTSPASESETEPSYLAPDFTVYDAEGSEVTLSSLFGKPTVLNFWASTCPPCRSEMPEFHAVYEEIGDEVQFVMVDCVGVYVGGSMETQEKGQAYIEEQDFTFPVYFDSDMDAVNTYGITSFPTTYFLDEDGNLVTYALGAIDKETLELGISMITEDTAT